MVQPLYPVEATRGLHPGTATPGQSDAAWRFIEDNGAPAPVEPAFLDQSGGGLAWKNTGVSNFPKLRYRLDASGELSIFGTIAKDDTPLGQYGSEIFRLPVGMRWIDSGGAGLFVADSEAVIGGATFPAKVTIWPGDAPSAAPLDAGGSIDLRGMVFWGGGVPENVSELRIDTRFIVGG